MENSNIAKSRTGQLTPEIHGENKFWNFKFFQK